jgi:hypothetical protein
MLCSVGAAAAAGGVAPDGPLRLARALQGVQGPGFSLATGSDALGRARNLPADPAINWEGSSAARFWGLLDSRLQNQS